MAKIPIEWKSVNQRKKNIEEAIKKSGVGGESAMSKMATGFSEAANVHGSAWNSGASRMGVKETRKAIDAYFKKWGNGK